MDNESITINNSLLDRKATTKNKLFEILFIITVMLIYPLPQIAIDIYLPSWPTMYKALHASHFIMQLSLTIYILCLGVAQLIYGPLSDIYGRKKILIIGTLIFSISSTLCIFINSATQLILLRAVQGLGIGCGFVSASALLADAFSGKKLAKMISYSAMIYASSLIFAPAIGSYLQHYIGWRANFTVMAIYSLLLLTMICAFIFDIKERSDNEETSIKTIVSNYLSLLSSFYFIGCVLCMTSAYGTMIAFNMVAPFLLQELMHVSVIVYGELLFIAGLAYFFGASINSYLTKHMRVNHLIILGMMLMTLSSLGLFTADFLGEVNATIVISFVSIAIFSLGFIYPNCFALALDVFPEKGYASAFIGSAILIGVSVIGSLVSHYNVDHEYCLSITFIILSLLTIISYILTSITKNKRPAHES